MELEICFDRVLRKVLQYMVRKKGIPEVLVRSVMSLYKGAKMDSELSEGFEVKRVLRSERCTKDLCCQKFFLQLR